MFANLVSRNVNFFILANFINLSLREMAEFPDAGKHCSVVDCRQLDLLPIICDACTRVLCKNHMTYESHQCTEAYKKNVKFPICPLCQQPVLIKRGEAPDLRVNEHIERDCHSETAQRRRTAPRCGLKNCFKRELVRMECASCGEHFCVGHRHQIDHNCTGSKASKQADANKKTSTRQSQDLDALYAQQLQQEEYERALNGNSNHSSSNNRAESRQNGNGNCVVS